MGHVRHNAIIVTSWNKDGMHKAYREAAAIDLSPSDLIPSPVNGYWSMLIPPTGSKMGWEEQQSGDEKRIRFRDWLRGQRYEDGSSPYEWVEVRYSHDDYGCGTASDAVEITDHAWSDDPSNNPRYTQ